MPALHHSLLEAVAYDHGFYLTRVIADTSPKEAALAQVFRDLIHGEVAAHRGDFPPAVTSTMITPPLVNVHTSGLDPDSIATALKFGAAIVDVMLTSPNSWAFFEHLNSLLPEHLRAAMIPAAPQREAMDTPQREAARAFVEDPQATLSGSEPEPPAPDAMPQDEGGTQPTPSQATADRT